MSVHHQSFFSLLLGMTMVVTMTSCKKPNNNHPLDIYKDSPAILMFPLK